MDFLKINEIHKKDGGVEIAPDFLVVRTKDLMVRAKSFYAVWDEEANLWSTDEYDVQRLVDTQLWDYRNAKAAEIDGTVHVSLMKDFGSGAWRQFRSYMANISDSSVQLDEKLTFANTEVKKTDYVSKRLPYSLEEGDISAYLELFNELYEPSELEKLEWIIGAIISGDSKHIQKFGVLYGPPGSGKGTWIGMLQLLFAGYYTTFEAKSLTSSNNAFATEVFRDNPLLAIQHDGDLSKIEDNSKINSIASHEDMTFNEKFKPSYTGSVNAFMVMGTNTAVKISDAKSGIIRRLIDIHPSGRKIAPRKYQALVSQLDFELGAIAYYCLQKYRTMGRDYYEGYRAVEMMLQTDIFYNYIEHYYEVFRQTNGVTLIQAYDMFKVFCEDSGIENHIPRFKFREELRNYFQNFEERSVVDGERVRSWYSGFKTDKFKPVIEEEGVLPLVMDETTSLFDEEMRNQPAQYAKDDESPSLFWTNEPRKDRSGELYTPNDSQVVSTVLSDLDTSKLHYTKVPQNHIVIDFDLTDEDGEKSAELNLEAASKWPATYAEWSKGGEGIHLHYNWAGDATELTRNFADHIEVKVFTGNSSLRRKLTKCNNVPIATLNSGIPLKEKKMINTEWVTTEKKIRADIDRNLRKEVHASTKPSVDFIHKILEDAYDSGVQYDVSDMKPAIMAFANNSSNQSLAALRIFQSMKFKSKETDEVETPEPEPAAVTQVEKGDDQRIVFFDVEVYRNLYHISWKYQGDANMVHMINPTSVEVQALMRHKLVGFNCRRYDNHILYGIYMGYNNDQIYQLSQKLIQGLPNAYFGEAYDVSYADIYDFSSEKMSLKKFEIKYGIPHKEMDWDWDKPIPEELWQDSIDYCDNDVIATEIVFEKRKQDFVARQILAQISGLSSNASTLMHTSRIIFGTNRQPQSSFIYTKLEEEFPGYVFTRGKSSYRDENPGEGGYVYSEPGMYENVALLDVESMHPTTIKQLNLFGEYTKTYWSLVEARLAIKHGDYAKAGKLFGGALKPYLKDESTAKELSYALKIVINIVYGLTSAKFDNPFRDKRNIDNIVAKRGALFMIELKHAVQEQGFTVAHIKTDSIKIPNATPEIMQFVTDFGAKYGYKFEHEATYDKLALVNDAVYVAHDEDGWHATGAQFQHPYVFKTLFSHEDITFRDLCEAKSVTTAIYLDMTESGSQPEDGTELKFIGKVGLFTPIQDGKGGGLLVRKNKDDGFGAVSNTKDWKWLESHMVETLGKQDDIEYAYFRKLVDDAVENLQKHGDVEWLLAA